MRAFVTGGTGFIGRHLIADLLAHGWAVTALARTLDRARSLPPTVHAIPGNILQPSTMRAAMRGADAVFHVAAWYAIGVKPKDRERITRINIEGARAVFDLAAELGIPKIIHTSSLAAYGDTRGQTIDETYTRLALNFASEYERTKYAAHFAVAVPLQQRGLPLTLVCPGLVYGPGDNSRLAQLLRAYARRRLPVMLGPNNAFTWAHVADIAAGHRLAAESGTPGGTYFLAGPPSTLRDFFKMCGHLTNLPQPFLWLPAALAAFLARPLRRLRPATAELLQSAAGVTHLARADKAQTELGWRARSLEDGLRDTFEHLT